MFLWIVLNIVRLIWYYRLMLLIKWVLVLMLYGSVLRLVCGNRIVVKKNMLSCFGFIISVILIVGDMLSKDGFIGNCIIVLVLYVCLYVLYVWKLL